MGIGGRSFPRAPRVLAVAVALLGSTSAFALGTVPSPGSEALVTGGGDQSTPEREAGVLSATDEPPSAPAEAVAPVAPTSTATGATASTDPAAPPTTSRAGTPSATAPATTATTTAPVAPPRPAEPVEVTTGLWVGQGGGLLRRISAEPGWTPLAWSPDGRAVAMARRGEVVILDPATGGRRPALLEPNMAAVRAAWSPDGRSLAVLLDGLPGPSKLVAVDLAAGGVVPQGPTSGQTSIGYTPAGCLAYGGGLANSTGVDNHGVVVACPGQSPRLVQGPLGTALQAVFPGRGFVYTRYATDISLMDFEGRPLPGITGSTIVSGGMDNVGQQLVVDKAGGTIVWVGGRDEGPVELHASRPGGATTTLSTCSVSAPAASANGVVVYSDGCATPGRWSLLRRSTVSSPPQVVATFPYYKATTPLISPDGRTLLLAVTSS